MGSTEPELIVASVALVISFVALTATFMQVLQQYYASASGYSQCNQEVMGAWAKSKSRRFSWEELRFVVQFDAPVIFVSPPSNTKGPISNAPIFFLDGTPKSRNETGTRERGDEPVTRQTPGNTIILSPKDGKPTEANERIQTADHERASWLVLLYNVQRMEAESCKWQKDQYAAHGPPNPASEKYGLMRAPPPLRECHTLTVAVQRKRKSWDTMPASVSRPYATTTMCHLVETMAALGVYWKEFDRSRDRYRAEGNGFMVLGERVSNLGLMFSFQVYGQCTFERNRVIPVDEVKELCFGFVPTIYRESSDPRRLAAPSDELRDLGSLQMATKSEIAQTLVVIGCNKNSVQHFLDDNGKTAHLFPMSFEIVGMLARTFHIDDSYFTYLPNPTPDRWDEMSLSLVKIMQSYGTLLGAEPVEMTRNGVIYRRVKDHVDEILRHQRDDVVGRLLLLKTLHAALADADEILTQRRREVVRDVLRSHFQEVLRLLNERDDRGFDTQSLLLTGVRPVSPVGFRQVDLPADLPSFEEINEASPDDRQHKFMQVYFEVIRPHVPRHRRASDPSAPAGYGLRARGTGGTQASVAAWTDPGTVAPSAVPVSPSAFSSGLDGASNSRLLRNEVVVEGNEGDETDEEHAGQDMENLGGQEQCAEPMSLANEPASHDDIWCVLVFRMICWLMLHDFHREDLQVSKSELLGSRMPVYIA
ncbi:modin protein [Hirsutella rhossiliensis]|uniref:Modin protein n=1 Tax=Hirsutella rhossiliensis TaxID=111463 RepID=A0A9P8MQU6_9HYPO|nr:modin protein [Hirsutella rhossiliensis]KAH0957552.1 modin protein [Hirsutella rhossiliensis]